MQIYINIYTHVFQQDDMQYLFPNSRQYNFLIQYLEWFQPHNLFWNRIGKNTNMYIHLKLHICHFSKLMTKRGDALPGYGWCLDLLHINATLPSRVRPSVITCTAVMSACGKASRWIEVGSFRTGAFAFAVSLNILENLLVDSSWKRVRT